ncbi:(2Fe-2S)-binding protein [Thiomicrorhabdus sp.]|uniref:(2Fe-2S)-binding protein n=1 Tax=Thiomicrorhabdus sp. TaxID=2039724 RepID=UPI003562A11B
MLEDALEKLPEILKKNLDRNLCVCNEVKKIDVIQAIVDGADTRDKVRAKTYASDGNGCCRLQVEDLLEALNEKK